MFIPLMCRCKNGHEWSVLLANYWFSPGECEQCGELAVAFRGGTPMDFDQVQEMLRPKDTTNDGQEGSAAGDTTENP